MQEKLIPEIIENGEIKIISASDEDHFLESIVELVESIKNSK